MKVRKKIEEFDACKWDESWKTLDKIGCSVASCEGHSSTPNLCHNLRIMTKEGSIPVRKGDWIVKDKNGKFTVLTENDFNIVYEEYL